MLGARGLFLGTALLMGACQPASVPEVAITSDASGVAGIRDEGDALMAKADYRQAVEKYRQAVELEPDSVPLRFALGTAYSFLDKRSEAIAQFQWLLSNATADTVEHREAQRWLVRVGALAEPAAASRAEREVSATKGEPVRAGRGVITGKTEWSGLDPAREAVRMNIALMGDEDATRSVKRKTAITLGDPYEFKDVPEGQYRVLGVLGEQTIIWDQKVMVQAGKGIDVALTQAISESPRFVFPQEAKPKAESPR